MPATRRGRPSTGAVAKSRDQKTISFNSNVSKHSTVPAPKDLSSRKSAVTSLTTHNLKSPLTPAPTPLDVSPSIDSASAIKAQAKVELKTGEGDGEKTRAEKVSDAQIRKYWNERERERRAPRVHQEGLGVEEKILRLFDMSSQFGPAIGIARMKRWNRAQKLGLAPPIEVLAVLLKEEKKGNDKIERAHVDELMSSKFVIGDAA